MIRQMNDSMVSERLYPDYPELSRQKWDVVVVGAGPAGSSLARHAAAAGARVLMLESRARIGEPLACAGFIPRMARQEIPLPAQVVDQDVTHLVTVLPDGQSHEMASPGYMVDRPALDRHLALLAMKAGATLRCQSRVIAVEPGRVHLRAEGHVWSMSTQIIAGCDGPHSVVARAMDESHRSFLPALQVEVRQLREEQKAYAFFHPQARGGYVWFFPHGEKAYLGLGTTDRTQLRPMLHHFLERLVREGRIDPQGVLGVSGGWIPIDTQARRTLHETILLAGDAAGHIDPITGAGIHPAAACGQLAGQLIARHQVHLYEKEWRMRFGERLETSRKKRLRLDREWDGPAFDALIRSCWLSYPEYYQT